MHSTPALLQSFKGRSTPFAIWERAVLAAEGLEGIVLRYGAFYGPGTSLGEGGKYVEAVRQRRSRSSATAPACGPLSTSMTCDHERGPRRVQFQGQARVQLAAALRKLARGFPERPRRLIRQRKPSIHAFRRREGLDLVGKREEVHRTVAETHCAVVVPPSEGVLEPVAIVAFGKILAGMGAAAFGAV